MGDEYDVILGMPFLEDVNPTIDWKKKTMTMSRSDGRRMVIESAKKNEPPKQQQQSSRQEAQTQKQRPMAVNMASMRSMNTIVRSAKKEGGETYLIWVTGGSRGHDHDNSDRSPMECRAAAGDNEERIEQEDQPTKRGVSPGVCESDQPTGARVQRCVSG